VRGYPLKHCKDTMMMKQSTFLKIIFSASYLLLMVIAHKPLPAYALSFLVPHELEQKGNAYRHYPSNQRYVYTDKPVFFSKRQPAQDGNEEDEYFRKKEQKAKKAQSSVVSLPLEQIISRSPATGMSAKASVLKPEITKENRNVSIIVFGFDSADIKKTELKKLEAILTDLKQAEVIEIKGYTDKIGTEEYNDKLALRRVDAVKNYLASRGINDSKIKIEAKGKCCYISDENSKNRRVEIWIEVETGKIILRSGSRL